MASYTCYALSTYLTISFSLVCPVFIISLITPSSPLGSFTFNSWQWGTQGLQEYLLGLHLCFLESVHHKAGSWLRTVSPHLTAVLDTQSQSNPCNRNTLDNLAPPRWPLPSKPRSPMQRWHWGTFLSPFILATFL